ncbi:MAG: WecB/TagA/CpsF family glycosyltransferase [Candidatus Margulisiibacteriota bacterium]
MLINFAGIQVDNVTLEEAEEKAEAFIISRKPHIIVTPNPEIIVTSQEDHELRDIVNSADLRVPDGISMVVVSKILGKPLKERVSGIDLMLKLIEISAIRGYKIFLYGGSEGVAKKAALNLKAKYPALIIVGIENGFASDDSKVIEKIKKAKPDILFVGLGAGKQERWLNRHLKELDVPVGMVIGGSMDVISGLKKRAPVWMQKMKIEWLYRLVTEPSRWKRQLALPKFLYLTLFKNVIKSKL